MKKGNLFFMWAILLAFSITGCGGGTDTAATEDTEDDGTDGTTSTITTLDGLPRATSPVVDSTADAKVAQLATTGMALGTEPDFDTSSSLAACEIYNETRQAMGEAAQGDTILCYIQTIGTLYEADSSVIESASAIDIDDGSFHVFALDSGGQDSGAPDHIKFRITKDSTSGAITDFTMYACGGGEQEMYLNQTIDGTTFAMISKGNYEDGTWSGSYQTDVDGTLNSSGKFTGDKVIRMRSTNSWDNGAEDSGDSWSDITFTQASDTAVISGYMDGTNSFQGMTFDWLNRISGKAQLIDPNDPDADDYDLTILALGEGAIVGQNSGTSDQGDSWDEDYEEAWDGDTTEPLVASDFLTEILADTTTYALPTATEPTIAFSGVESYDCTDTEEGTIMFGTVGTEVEASCGSMDLGSEWIDCWNTVEGNQ